MLSITLRMKPALFQFGWSGWTTPFVLVQRTIRLSLPDAGAVTLAFQRLKLYVPSSLPSCTFFQLCPPSMDSSTSDTPLSPPNAMPRNGIVALGDNFVAAVTLVKKERGTMRLIGTVANPVSSGWTFARGVSGMRYAVFIQ